MFAEIRFQSTCRWKMFVEFLYMLFHVSFLYESSAVVHAVRLKTRSQQFSFLKSLWQLHCIYLLFYLCLWLKRKAGK